MRLVFAGTPEAALPSLRALLASHHDVAAVVTRPDAPRGRGRHLEPSPVARLAAEHGLEVLRPARAGAPEFLERLAELAPDCCPVVAYGQLLPERTLAVPRLGWVNLHFSLLPAWRGAAPVQHALWRGDEVTGASVFQIVKELDAGPVYGRLTEELAPRDTAGDVLGRLALSGAELLLAVLDALDSGSARADEQPHEGVSFAPKITVEDARVRWEAPAFAVDRQVRACTPEPGAWGELAGERLRFAPVEPADEAEAPELKSGELLAEKRRVLVGTATTPVVLGLVQPPGKRPMAAADWARGARLAGGERLA